MAYFTQAGGSATYSEGSSPKQGSASQSYQQSQGASETYRGPGTESYAQTAYAGDASYAVDPEQVASSHREAYQPPAPARDFNRMVGVVGGVASLALVIGLGVWSYKLIVRDVSGVPVVRALEGPMRIAPETPGGRQADNQGLAVNAVAAFGTAEAPADRLTLAPAAIDLTEDDKTFAELRQVQNLTAPADLQLDTALVEREQQPQRVAQGFQNGAIDSLVAELTQDSPALAVETRVAAVVAADVASSPLRDIEPVVATVPLNVPGVRVSLRPNLRPTRFSTAPVANVNSNSALDVDADTLVTGTRLAQIGAHESAEVAQAEWDRISGKFSDYFAGKQRVIQRAEKGGRPVYRLRVLGFTDLSDARRFCSLLVSGREDCIPATIR